MSAYRNGVDLIMGIVVGGTFKPLGYSTGCKISDSTETGERVTKETGAASWKEKYIKSLSEQVTAEGFVYDDVAASSVSFPDLKSLWLNKTPVTLRYKYRNDGNLFEGTFIITSLEQDGPADDDEKWSVTFENSGAITPATGGTVRYRVSYNGNGKTITNMAAIEDDTEYSPGDTVTVAATEPTAASGAFDEWNTRPDGSGTAYQPADTFTINADTTLYAQWTA